MKKYLEPEIDIREFDIVDVITSSDLIPPDPGDDGLGWG